MGFWQRLIKLEDRVDPVRVALVGDDSNERKLLEAAYLQNSKTKVVFSGGTDGLEKMLRQGAAELVEIFAEVEKRVALAEQCLEAGVNVSVGMPPALTAEKIDSLKQKAELRGKLVRVRNQLLYYHPYQKARELLEQEKIGYATMLKLVVKRNRLPHKDFDRANWMLEHESDYLALAQYFFGPVEKIFVINGSDGNNTVGSMLLGFKFKTPHRFGYLLADFAPELQIRTFTEPVFRQVWMTGTAGVIMANRGEGQLWRLPPLLLRAKNYSHTFEDLKDNWEDVYPAMVNDMVGCLREHKPLVSGLELAAKGIAAALAAAAALEAGQEVLIAQ